MEMQRFTAQACRAGPVAVRTESGDAAQYPYSGGANSGRPVCGETVRRRAYPGWVTPFRNLRLADASRRTGCARCAAAQFGTWARPASVERGYPEGIWQCEQF